MKTFLSLIVIGVIIFSYIHEANTDNKIESLERTIIEKDSIIKYDNYNFKQINNCNKKIYEFNKQIDGLLNQEKIIIGE